MRAGARRAAQHSVLGLILALALVPFALRIVNDPHAPIDLNVYLAGAHAALSGDLPYSQPVIAIPGATGNFTYTPFAAIAFIPLSRINQDVAAIVWMAVNATALVLLVAISWSALLSRTKGMRRILALAALTVGALLTIPVASAVHLGQVGIVLTLLCLLDLTGSTRMRGFLIGVATAVKLTPGLFIVWFLFCRQWRPALRAIAMVVALWGATAVLLPQATRDFFFEGAFLDPTRLVGDTMVIDNQSLLAATQRWGFPIGVWLAASGAVLALAFWRARTAYRLHQPLAAATLIGLASTLVSPVSWLHHAIWLVPAIAVVAGSGRSMARVIWAIALWAAACVMPVTSLAPGSMQPDLAAPDGVLAIAAEGFTILYVLLVVLLPNRPEPSADGDADPEAVQTNAVDVPPDGLRNHPTGN